MVSFLLLLYAVLPSQGHAQAMPDGNQADSPVKRKITINPAIWLHRSERILIQAENRIAGGMDTGFLEADYPRMKKDFALAVKDVEAHGHHMRIRDLDDVKSKLEQQRKQLEKWRYAIRKQNDSIFGDFSAVEALIKDSVTTVIKTDSVLWSIYSEEFRAADSLLAKVDALYSKTLRRTVAIENALNRNLYDVNQTILSAEKELRQRNVALYTRTQPPFWQLRSDTYPDGIVSVFLKTVRQNFDSLEFYIKNAYVRAILFRMVLLLITLLPIWYFKKNRERFSKTDKNSPYKFVHKYTGASTSSFVLVIAPFIFINAPHLFIEAIFVTLAVTTSIIFIRENPGWSIRNMYALLLIYILLKVMNLMMSVTLFGRIFWALSIVGLIPLFSLYMKVKLLNIRYHNFARFIILLTSLMYLGGWILNLTGHYPLGRILLLAGLDQLFLAIILYVAVYSLIDFVGILADIYNSSNKTTTIRVDLIYRKLLTLVRTLAIIFWFWTFILNINAGVFIKQHVLSLLSQNVTIAGVTMTPGSIFIFFTVLYLSFYISSLLDGLFYDEKRSSETSDKTSLGSIVLLLRLFIISTGFILGMIIAGIPLNSVGLFFGALGVGIGFGLQGLISNLISGIVLAFERPVYVGDIIEIDGQRGRVTDIGLRAIKVDTADGAEYVVPNGNLTNQILKNWTLSSKHFKVENFVYVGLENDVSEVSTVLKDAVKKAPGILSSPPPLVRLKEITPTSLKFSVSCWVNDINKAGSAQDELLQKIHLSLDNAGIRYPEKKDFGTES